MAEEDEAPKLEDDLGNTENIANEEWESWNPGDTVVAPQLDDPLQTAVIRLKDKTDRDGAVKFSQTRRSSFGDRW